MINKSEKKDLILFYKLSKRGDQVNQQILGRNYATYIETVGQKIIQDNKDPIGKYHSLLDWEEDS